MTAIVAAALIFWGGSGYTKKYLSPEQICYSAGKQEIYVGYATSPAIAVINPGEDKVESMIALPSPVNGICTMGNFLYASLKDNESRIAVCDLEKKKIRKKIQVGYGPCDMAVSGDSLLFVANRYSNDVSVVDTKKLSEVKRIRAIREPSALSVSPNGKMIAVTNSLPSASAMDDFISAVLTIIDIEQLEAMKNIALPNGSYALNDVVFSPDGAFIYVTHQLGRYNVLSNQIEKGWINTNAVSVFDANTLEWYNTVLLDDIYLGAANPCGMEISGDGEWLYVAISGTHELFIIDLREMHRQFELCLKEDHISQTTKLVNDPNGEIRVPVYKSALKIEPMPVLFEDIPNELGFLASIRKRVQLQGNGPRQMIVLPSGNSEKIYLPGYYSEGIDIIENQSGKISNKGYIVLGSSDPEQDPLRFGELLFHDASHCFQQWQSCASCHPGEGRADGLNWDLLNDGIGNPKNTKSLLYSHQTPPAMITGIRPDAETAVRAGFNYIQFSNISEQNAAAVDAYLRSLQPVPSPFLDNGNLSEEAIRGKSVFERANCGHCHSGSLYTDLKTHQIGERGKYDKQNHWDTPTLVELWRTSPYMHNGEYSRMEDVFKTGMHGLEEPLSDEEISSLSTFLLSL